MAGHRTPGILLLALLAAACSRPAPPPPPPPPPAPAADDLLGAPGAALRVQADTVATVHRPAGPVTIRDLRSLRRAASGDFQAVVRRVHEGSEEGDTDESATAVRAGRDYFTRGSGGPFVQWDDARDEPDAAAAAVLQGTRDLLALAARCGTARDGEGGRHWTLSGPGCDVASAPSGAPFRARVTRLEGLERRAEGRLASLDLVVGLDLQAGGRRSDVSLEHRVRIDDLPASEAPAAPAAAVPARRDRPVQMARSVLSGLVDAFGPGAPAVLRRDAPAPDAD